MINLIPIEYLCFSIEIFYENGALEALIGLFNDPTCPDHQQVLETIMTLSDAKSDAISSLEQSNRTLMEQFEEKLTERRQAIQGSDDDQVGFSSKCQCFSISSI